MITFVDGVAYIDGQPVKELIQRAKNRGLCSGPPVDLKKPNTEITITPKEAIIHDVDDRSLLI
jgi:hypothetical protein